MHKGKGSNILLHLQIETSIRQFTTYFSVQSLYAETKFHKNSHSSQLIILHNGHFTRVSLYKGNLNMLNVIKLECIVLILFFFLSIKGKCVPYSVVGDLFHISPSYHIGSLCIDWSSIKSKENMDL